MNEIIWKKSTKSSPSGDNCVEVAIDGTDVLVRDSKLGEDSPILRFTQSEWEAFVGGARDGEFNF